MTATFRLLGNAPSFGFGDRIGNATPGHIEAMRRAGDGIEPIYCQQSIREMSRTGRDPETVVLDAVSGMKQAGWTGGSGADADHLKTTEDVQRTADAGFVFFTIDPSAYVDDAAATDDEATLRKKVEALRDSLPWLDETIGREVELDTGTTVSLDEESTMRCAAKYGAAIAFAKSLADDIASIQNAAGRGFEIELSVDETDAPTTLAEHWIFAEQCHQHGMPLVSLAPRFIGDFEKGIDFKGNGEVLRASLADHAAIARALGEYKLSLHSGSDKLSMYADLANATQGRCHVKTAGTSYLEALRVAARRDETLFRQIVAFARDRYETDRATYHLSATLDDAPPADAADAQTLELAYLGDWAKVPEGQGFTTPGRQIVHCTFGSVLCDEELGPALRGLLEAEPDLATELMADHFERHLRALQAGMR